MKSFFPATYSTLCATALSALVTENYGLTGSQCQLLLRGVGDTYLVRSAFGQHVLRVYRNTHRNLAQIREEVQLLLGLQAAGVSVSYPIADRSGNTIQVINAVEGERHAVLFSYAAGHSVKQMKETQLRSLGREMARFHKTAQTIAQNGSRWRFDLETTLYRPLIQLQPSIEAADPETYNWLKQAASQVAAKLSLLNADQFPEGYCHFDFLPKNFHFENDMVTIFDFDFMGYGWLVNDIMSFWQHLSLEVYTQRMTQVNADDAYARFLEGYKEHNAVSEAELAAVPYLSLGFWLFYMGFHTTHDQFYPFAQPTQQKVYTTLVKHIAATYWEQEDHFWHTPV